jgi:hypothetical protein
VIFVSMLLVSVGFLCMRTLGTDASYFEVFWPLLVIGSGFGMCTAPTRTAIMTAAPDEKQGVAPAVNDATREIGGAVGVALAGSILAGSYGHRIAAAMAGLPGPVRGPASASLAQALEAANRMGASLGRSEQGRVCLGHPFLVPGHGNCGRYLRPRRTFVSPGPGRHPAAADPSLGTTARTHADPELDQWLKI